MRHIEEPLLQAYVDGFCSEARVQEIEAHLSACAACAARLEDARAAAARASQLLGSLEPGPVHAPSFEELKERAGNQPADATRVLEALQQAQAATAPSRARNRGRKRLNNAALAWAATVVVAFAVGWMSRGGLGNAPAPSVRGPVAATGADGFRSPATEPPEVATANRASEARPQAAADAGASAPDGAAEAGAAVREAVASAELATAAEETRQDVASTDEAGRSGSPPAARKLEQQAAMTPPAAARVESAPSEPDAARDAALPARPAVTSSFAIPAADAELWLGAPLRTIPDLAPRRVELVPAASVDDALPGRIAVRIIYETATGEQVALLQQYAGPGPGRRAAEAFADEERTEVAAQSLRPGNRAVGESALTRAADALAAAALFDALDLPSTVRDPDGRVRYTWHDGEYLLRISAVLDADAVRGLSSRVR